jgi:hypothetical protein
MMPPPFAVSCTPPDTETVVLTLLALVIVDPSGNTMALPDPLKFRFPATMLTF